MSPFVFIVLISNYTPEFAFVNSEITQFVCARDSLLPLVPILYFNSSPF